MPPREKEEPCRVIRDSFKYYNVLLCARHGALTVSFWPRVRARQRPSPQHRREYPCSLLRRAVPAICIRYFKRNFENRERLGGTRCAAEPAAHSVCRHGGSSRRPEIPRQSRYTTLSTSPEPGIRISTGAETEGRKSAA